MEDKTRIIERIVSSPETLTPADILAISTDSELRELYETSVMMASALTDAPDFDTDRSLARLHALIADERPNENPQSPQTSHEQGIRSPKGFAHRLHTNFRLSKAAVTIGVMLMAMAVVAAIYFAPTDRQPAPASVTAPAATADTEGEQPQSQQTGKLYYDDAPLAQILDDVASRYGCMVQYNNPESRDIRLHLTIPADYTLQQVAETLNAFDDVRITISDTTIIVD